MATLTLTIERWSIINWAQIRLHKPELEKWFCIWFYYKNLIPAKKDRRYAKDNVTYWAIKRNQGSDLWHFIMSKIPNHQWNHPLSSVTMSLLSSLFWFTLPFSVTSIQIYIIPILKKSMESVYANFRLHRCVESWK